MSWILEGALGDAQTGQASSNNADSAQVGIARVEFFQAADRIAHRVLIERDGRSATWESIEGDDLQNWPPSPPYQEISLERIGDQDVALLVGMAGKSHWSLRVDIDPVRASIRFDVACRIAVEPDFLGSKYRGSTDSVICDSATIIDSSEDSRGEGFDGWCARPQLITAPRATIRWAYEFTL